MEEFADITDADVEAQTDFWSRLEDGWKELNAQDSQPWLDEFENNFETYKFQAENGLKDLENCLEEGKKKLEEGDLPSAVLYFEAAVQQEPQNAEAWTLLGTSQV